MTTRLTDIIVDEISLVDKAANRRRFHLFKQRGDVTVTKDELLAAFNDLDEAVRAEVKKSLGFGEPDLLVEIKKLDEKALADLYTTLKVMEEHPDGPVAAFEAALSKASDEDRAATLKKLGLTVDTTKKDEDRIAQMDPKDRALIVKAQEQAAEAEKTAKTAAEEVEKLKLEKKRERFIKKVGEFDTLPGVTADDFGPILMKIADALEDKENEKFMEVLKGAAAMLEDSALFVESGSARGGTEDGSALGALNAAAAELQKQDPKLTHEQAFAQVYKTKHDLRKAYNREETERKQRRGASDLHGVE